MANWDPRQYLQFEAERTQPSVDLAARIPLEGAARVLDVGCGPGNSTAVLQRRFPGAALTGVDSSAEMVAAAQNALPDARFLQCDITGDLSALGAGWDVVFSNACLQWVPDHARLLPRLLGLLRPGGVLAVQIPLSEKQPVHTVIRELAQSPRWRDYFPQARSYHTLAPAAYFELLDGAAAPLWLWETSYLHVLPGHAAIVEWYKGTGLRPYLAALPGEERPAFEAGVLDGVRQVYPAQPNGKVIFPFPRLFFVAVAGQ